VPTAMQHASKTRARFAAPSPAKDLCSSDTVVQIHIIDNFLFFFRLSKGFIVFTERRRAGINVYRAHHDSLTIAATRQ
jgi:hypothetical protein